MKTIFLQILHYLWIRKDNIIDLYIKIKNNKNIKIDWKLSLEELYEYKEVIETSWLAPDNEEEDKKIYTGWEILWNISKNKSKRLLIDQQNGVECVPNALIRTINYNTSIEINENLKNIYIEDMKKQGLFSSQWSYVHQIADYLKKRIQADFGTKLVYFKEPYYTETYNELRDKWYAHWIGWGITSKYRNDFLNDWVIDDSYNFKEVILYYHLFMNLPPVEALSRNWNIVENYNIRYWINNIYSNKNINEFVESWVFFWNAYFFVEEDIVNEERIEEIKSWPYRKLFWSSVIKDPKSLIKTIRTWTDDEATACLEIISKRVVNKLINNK